MGSSRANLLLRNARKKYNVILLTGPSLEQATDLQCLAADSDALVLAFDEREPLTKNTSRSIEDLMQLEIPVMAVVA